MMEVIFGFYQAQLVQVLQQATTNLHQSGIIKKEMIGVRGKYAFFTLFFYLEQEKDATKGL